MTKQPTVGSIVHYVSYGTPGGEYTSECRAAIVTETNTSDTVGLCVLNPTGQFFNRTITHDEDEKRGGTWHWPEGIIVAAPVTVNIEGLAIATEADAKQIAEYVALAMGRPLKPEPEISVYSERARLIAYLATNHDARIAYNDPNEPDWPVIYIDTPRGQLSWHLSPDDLHLFPHVPIAGRHITIDQAPAWDGHTTAEKYDRLARLVEDEAEGRI